MTATSMGTRVMAASNSSEFEAAATTWRPRSLRRASARSCVWIRVLSATTILTKSEPSSSWDDIRSPDKNMVARIGRGTGKLRSLETLIWGEKVKRKNRPESLYIGKKRTVLPSKMYHQSDHPASKGNATYAKKCNIRQESRGLSSLHNNA